LLDNSIYGQSPKPHETQPSLLKFQSNLFSQNFKDGNLKGSKKLGNARYRSIDVDNDNKEWFD
jgi:hypothetical protein